MANNNELFLQQATAVVKEIEIRYLSTDFDEQFQMREERDRAMIVYSEAKLKLLKNQVQCKPEDVQEMQKLRKQIEDAPDVSHIISGVGRFVGFLRSRFLFV
jgi:transcriptional/translational regulatory protein YebC/TACO1